MTAALFNSAALSSDLSRADLAALSQADLIDIILNQRHENKILNEQLDEIRIEKSIEAGSGLLSRETFFEEGNLLFERANQAECSPEGRSTKFAVVIIDVNGLKAVNDVLGHRAGDELIAATSAHIANQFERRTDVSGARYGGDEIALLLPDTSEKFIREKLDALKDNICIPRHDGTIMSAQFSYGICQFDNRYENLKEMIDIADQAMYQDKQAKKAQGVTTRWHTKDELYQALVPASTPAGPGLS